MNGLAGSFMGLSSFCLKLHKPSKPPPSAFLSTPPHLPSPHYNSFECATDFPDKSQTLLQSSPKQRGQDCHVNQPVFSARFCHSLLSLAVMNALTKGNLERKGFLWLAHLYDSPSLAEVRAELKQKQRQDSWSMLLTGFFSLACSSCFLVHPSTTA